MTARLASQDAEILRLRWALEEIAVMKTAYFIRQTPVVALDQCRKIARDTLASSPAPQDAVIVPRELLTRALNYITPSSSGHSDKIAAQLRALLAPTPSKE